VWLPGSANAVCPRRPQTTQVQHWAKTARIDHVTLRPWLHLVGHGASAWLMRVVVLHPCTKFEFVGFAVRKIWRTMCVNGPGDLELWPFDLETGTRVASEVGNLHSEFGHARPLGSPVIRYVRDGRTKPTLNAPFPNIDKLMIHWFTNVDGHLTSYHCNCANSPLAPLEWQLTQQQTTHEPLVAGCQTTPCEDRLSPSSLCMGWCRIVLHNINILSAKFRYSATMIAFY